MFSQKVHCSLDESPTLKRYLFVEIRLLQKFLDPTSCSVLVLKKIGFYGIFLFESFEC